MFKQFIGYYKPHLKLFIMDMVCSFIVAVCDLFYPIIAGNMIDDYVPNRSLRLMIVWSAALLVIYLLKAALNWFIQYYGHIMGVRMQADMRRDVFRHLQRLPFSYFDDHKTGVIMSRIMNDLMDICELAHHGPETLFTSVVSILGAFFILCTINVPLTIIIFLAIPPILFFCIKMRVRMHKSMIVSREKIAEVNANLENSISGVRVSKAYTGADYEQKKFDRSNEEFKGARGIAYRVMAQFQSGMMLFTDLLYLLALVAAGAFYYNNIIGVGDFAKYLLFVSMFLKPIRKLVQFYEQLQNGMTGFQRFRQLMEIEEEQDASDAAVAEKLSGVIDFKNVSFQYESSKDSDAQDSGEKLVINDLSLHIEQGKTVALVGPSGSGKTTLCHLIPRFYEVTGGEIDIDGHNITSFTRRSLRENIGIVAQDVFLFTGTVRENIAYGRPDATEEEIIDAAKKANIHDYIMTLPEGYDAYIGERGIKLSGGQKQRISIARVFLKNPSILILDEATSAMDNATEMLIQGALEKLAEGRTCIVVAHRLSTIKNADEIIVLTDEGIKERGNHDELLALDGIYAGLYRYQFKHN